VPFSGEKPTKKKKQVFVLAKKDGLRRGEITPRGFQGGGELKLRGFKNEKTRFFAIQEWETDSSTHQVGKKNP